MVDNAKLAQFITSLGSLNDYGSTVAQTKEALELKSTGPLKQDGEDVAIFQDALKGIAAIQRVGFSVDGIISVNQAFDTPSPEQPKLPGHLRNAYYNEDDRIAVVVGSNARQGYFPPEVVTRQDLQDIVDAFNASDKRDCDGWQVFARLSKLQPFQDGNKRTALIAANAAIGALSTQAYLLVPHNDLDRLDFTTSLMRYYIAENEAEEQQAFDRLLNFTEKGSLASEESHHVLDLTTRVIKTEIKKTKNEVADEKER